MDKQFVTYEIARLLKGLGYNEPCMAFRWEKSTKLHYELGERTITNSQLTDLSTSTLLGLQGSTFMAAPLWQQCIDWFRIEHSLVIRDNLADNSTGTYNPLEEDFQFIIIKCSERSTRSVSHRNQDRVYDTYEEAREQIILDAIGILKKK